MQTCCNLEGGHFKALALSVYDIEPKVASHTITITTITTTTSTLFDATIVTSSLVSICRYGVHTFCPFHTLRCTCPQSGWEWCSLELRWNDQRCSSISVSFQDPFDISRLETWAWIAASLVHSSCKGKVSWVHDLSCWYGITSQRNYNNFIRMARLVFNSVPKE